MAPIQWHPRKDKPIRGIPQFGPAGAIRLGSPGTGLDARIIEATYMGTDTHYTLGLSDGSQIVARIQSNSAGAFGIGDPVGASIDTKAVQVLKS